MHSIPATEHRGCTYGDVANSAIGCRSHQLALRLGALVSLTVLGCAPPSASARARQPQHLHEIGQAEIEAALNKEGSTYDLVRRHRENEAATSRNESGNTLGTRQDDLPRVFPFSFCSLHVGPTRPVE